MSSSTSHIYETWTGRSLCLAKTIDCPELAYSCYTASIGTIAHGWSMVGGTG